MAMSAFVVTEIEYEVSPNVILRLEVHVRAFKVAVLSKAEIDPLQQYV